MNIVMMTNTYLPHVGGVARSVETFVQAYRRAGHHVLVVAPEFPGQPAREYNVVRVPAVQRFNGSDFSVSLPVSMVLANRLRGFRPDIIHSHHPFLLGDTALRVSASLERPLVFTHHTQYEHYTHYVPTDSSVMKRFAIELATGYANLADQVFAPSSSIRDLLRERGVETPVEVLPTGIPTDAFKNGDGERFRDQTAIPEKAPVVGHVGRLAEEKNVRFLVEAVTLFLSADSSRYFVIVGDGPLRPAMERQVAKAGVQDQVRFTGTLTGEALHDAYQAMDLFAFASTTETQGMVLAEAMAALTPVVALEAPGVNDVVQDGDNGAIVSQHDPSAFQMRLEEVMADLGTPQWEAWQRAAAETAARFDQDRCAERALERYEQLLEQTPVSSYTEWSALESIRGRLQKEWNLWLNRLSALGGALGETDERAPRPSER